MKAVPSVLVFVVFSVCAGAAEISGASAVVPQPRIRLQLTSAGTAVRVDAVPAEPAPETPAMMDKLVVTETKVPATPRTFVPEDRASFSLMKGGPLAKKKLGATVLEFGVWTWVDLFGEDSRFKGSPTRAQFDLVRLKW